MTSSEVVKLLAANYVARLHPLPAIRGEHSIRGETLCPVGPVAEVDGQRIATIEIENVCSTGPRKRVLNVTGFSCRMRPTA